MAMRWCYIGELGPDDRLDWGRGPGGNVPASGLLPDIDEGYLYLKVMHLAMNGEYDGGAIDFDAYGLKVSGAELRQVIQDCYAEKPDMLNNTVIRQYLRFADHLSPNKQVALVACSM